MGLTAELGNYVEAIKFNDIPEDAVELACNAFSDTVGVMMSGISEPVVQIIYNEFAVEPMPRQARACLSDKWVLARDAALINGAAAHALDFDDQALTGHPSAVLVPAILAEGEFLKSSGKAMIAAYVAGYEVWAELVRRSSNYHLKGWHPTSVFGVVAASAAVSFLHRHSAEKTMMALALATSHASGLAVNFGTMTKPYHAGMAASNGLVSARLSGRGITASRVAIENAEGFLTAFSPTMEADRNSPSRLGKEWYIVKHRLCVKRYPTCYFMHRSFEGVMEMIKGKNIRPDDVKEMVVTMGRGQTTVLRNDRPRTGLEAKFSAHFAMAAALILGRMGIDELSDEVVQRDDMQAFFPKIQLNAIDEYDQRDPAHSPYDRVVIHLNNGTSLDSGKLTRIPGHAYEPLTTNQLWQKFRECTTRTHDEVAARTLFDATQELPDLISTTDLPSAEGLFES